MCVCVCVIPMRDIRKGQSSTGLHSYFFSPRLFAMPSQKYLCAQQFTLFWRENHWIHAFPKGINGLWDKNSFI